MGPLLVFLLGSARNATKILEPSVSGVLVVAVGNGPAIAFDALSSLIAAGCLARLPIMTSAATPRGTGIPTDIHKGWTQFRRTPWVWAVTVAFCVVNLAQTGTWHILGPALTKQVSSEATWGFVLSARGVGLLVAGARDAS